MKLTNLISKAFGQVQSTNRTQIMPERKDSASKPMNTHLNTQSDLSKRIIEGYQPSDKLDTSNPHVGGTEKPIEKSNYINSKSKQLTNDIAMELLLLDEGERIKILEATMGLIESIKALDAVKRKDFRVFGAEIKIDKNDNKHFYHGKFPNY